MCNLQSFLSLENRPSFFSADATSGFILWPAVFATFTFFRGKKLRRQWYIILGLGVSWISTDFFLSSLLHVLRNTELRVAEVELIVKLRINKNSFGLATKAYEDWLESDGLYFVTSY